MEGLNISGIDEFIEKEVRTKYEGHFIEFYASGFGFGIRDVSYNVFPEDGNRFVIEAKYDVTSGIQMMNKDDLTIIEKPYIEYCYFCETEPATTDKFNELACEKCKTDEYRQIENPETASKRTDEQNAKRQKTMKMVFDVAFKECWYCENEEATTTKLGQKICDTCNAQEIRTSAPIHKMNEYEKATQLRIGLMITKTMSNRGREALE